VSLSNQSEAGDHGKQSFCPVRVLVIGKNVHIGASLEQALTRHRCLFDHAAGSAHALRQLRSTAYGVVITDPGTSIEEDLALLEEIRGIRPSVRAIVLAPSGTPEEIIAALRQRVFLCKCAPFDAGEIAGYAVSAIETADSPIGIEVLSAHPDWISLRMNCHMLNADRLMEFLNSNLKITLTERPGEQLMAAFGEILRNAIEHGAHNDPSKLVQVAAVRTARALVFYICDPGEGFRRDAILHAAISNTPDQPNRHIEIRERAGMRPGGFGILLASEIVDELIYSEMGNEVLLIKYMTDSEPTSGKSETRGSSRLAVQSAFG